jgi:hypothetical protein
VAQGFFVGALGVAVSKTQAIIPNSSMYINVEAHSIAFSSLYFWIIPAVFLGAVIGVSQTEKSIRDTLVHLREDFANNAKELSKANNISPPLPSIKLPEAHFFNQAQLRILRGGIYSWNIDKSRPSSTTEKAGLENNHALAKIGELCLSVGSILLCGITAGLISWYVPAEGWQPRHTAYIAFMAGWVSSFIFGKFIKLVWESKLPEQDSEGDSSKSKLLSSEGRPSRLADTLEDPRLKDPPVEDPGDISMVPFWLTFAKDILFAGSTLAFLLYVQDGPYNNCESYSQWGHAGVALPGSPDVATTLTRRIHGLYRIAAFLSISIQLAVIPTLTLIWNRRALRVLLMTDDETSLVPDWVKWVRKHCCCF